jgi:hypothetical protein
METTNIKYCKETMRELKRYVRKFLFTIKKW